MDRTATYPKECSAKTTAVTIELEIGPTRSVRAVGMNTTEATSERCAVSFCCARTVTASLRSGDRPKSGAEISMCARHHVGTAVNGKAVHGTGGVNYLPHMFAICIAPAAVIWLKAIIARLLLSGSARELRSVHGLVPRPLTTAIAPRKRTRTTRVCVDRS